MSFPDYGVPTSFTANSGKITISLYDRAKPTDTYVRDVGYADSSELAAIVEVLTNRGLEKEVGLLSGETLAASFHQMTNNALPLTDTVHVYAVTRKLSMASKQAVLRLLPRSGKELDVKFPASSLADYLLALNFLQNFLLHGIKVNTVGFSTTYREVDSVEMETVQNGKRLVLKISGARASLIEQTP